MKGVYASAQSPEDESRAYEEHCLHNMRALSLTRAYRENPINKTVLANILCGPRKMRRENYAPCAVL